MTDQPPVPPPDRPSGHPAQQPGQANPGTQPMPAAVSSATPITPSASPPRVPSTSVWHQATSTHGGRWALAAAAGLLAFLMLLGIGVAGLLLLRNHDRFALMGQRQNGFSRQLGQGNGRGHGNLGGSGPQQPGLRGPGQGLGGLGGLLGGTALHGNVTAALNGSVQALVFQRGDVTAVGATAITIRSSDGFVGTYTRTPATSSIRAVPVTGGQALVLARASDKVAITIVSTSATSGVGPTS